MLYLMFYKKKMTKYFSFKEGKVFQNQNILKII